MEKIISLEEARQLLAPMQGEISWGIKLGVGSFLTIELGKPKPRKNQDDTVHGEWHIWLYFCSWRLEKQQEILIGSGDSRSAIEACIQCLEDLVLEELDIQKPLWDAAFYFEKGYVLRVFSISSHEGETFMIFIPNDQVISFGPDSKLTLEIE